MNRLLHWLKKSFVPHEHNGYQSHFLRHTSISFFLLLVIIIEVGFFVQVFYVFDKTKFLAAVLPGVITSITNDERAELGLTPLIENALLDRAAELKAEDMATKSYFAHTSPQGITPWYWFGAVGYNYAHAGENLAVNFFESADVAEAWMNSPSHKANIVKADYTEIGVGVASGTYEGRRTIFVVQLFGTPAVSSGILPPVTKVLNTPTSPPLPEAVVVLGEETPAPSPVSSKVIETTTKQTTSPRNVELTIEKTLTSPLRGATYAYTAIALMALVAVALAMIVKSELRHPGMVAKGVGLIAVIVVLSIINLKVLHLEPKIPENGNNLSANAVSALK